MSEKEYENAEKQSTLKDQIERNRVDARKLLIKTYHVVGVVWCRLV